MPSHPFRALVAALGLAVLATPVPAVDLASLRASFEGLGARARTAIQQELATGSFYSGTIDGQYGPGTEQALVDGAAFLERNSRARMAFDLDSAAGIAAYLSALLSHEAAGYLYGEGEEEE